VSEQLDLFGHELVLQAKPAPTAPEQTPPSAPTESLADQMDLFGDRWQRATAAHKALERFDLEAAVEALREAVSLYPGDATLLERANIVAKVAAALRSARRKTKSMAWALALIEPKIPAFLADDWHRRLAEVMEEEAGAGAILEGISAGFHWLEAGDPARAEQSLRATLDREPSNCRARGHLGDALFQQGRVHEARLAYRDALSMEPADVAIASAADEAVRELPSQASDEFELPGAPVEWAAAVGLIERVFLPPASVPEEWLAPDTLAALAPGLRFYRWLVAEKFARDDARRIACRRAMKALSPRLLKELLDRRG